MTEITPQEQPPAPTPAGWYPVEDGAKRYWDGTAWTEHYDRPRERKPRRRIPLAASMIFTVLALLIGVAIGAGSAGRGNANLQHDLTEAAATINSLESTVSQLRARLATAQAATDDDEPAQEEPAPAPASTITFTLEGDGNTAKVQMRGDYSFTWQTAGDCYYSADLEDGSESLFRADAATDGSGFVYDLAPGEYYVEMITGPAPSCGWSIVFTPL